MSSLETIIIVGERGEVLAGSGDWVRLRTASGHLNGFSERFVETHDAHHAVLDAVGGAVDEAVTTRALSGGPIIVFVGSNAAVRTAGLFFERLRPRIESALPSS